MLSPRLTPQQQKEIRDRFREGQDRQSIATAMNVTYNQVQNLLNKKPVRKSRSPEEREGEDLQQKYDELKAKFAKAVAILVTNDLMDFEF